jgi:hypothetical protein
MVKKQLKQTQKSDPDTLFGQLDEISDAIPAEEWERVFQAWVDWVQQVSDGNRNYITQ